MKLISNQSTMREHYQVWVKELRKLYKEIDLDRADGVIQEIYEVLGEHINRLDAFCKGKFELTENDLEELEYYIISSGQAISSLQEDNEARRPELNIVIGRGDEE